MPDFLIVCEQAARAGGAVLLDWVERFTVREKAPADLVTEADVASQETVRRILLSAFPDHEFLSEEEPAVPISRIGEKTAGESAHPPTTIANRYRWIVDPLDGTTNYVHRIPEFAVSLALEREGEVLVGCVFNPVAGECYTAGAAAELSLTAGDWQSVPRRSLRKPSWRPVFHRRSTPGRGHCSISTA